jgi:hypothetical protein
LRYTLCKLRLLVWGVWVWVSSIRGFRNGAFHAIINGGVDGDDHAWNDAHGEAAELANIKSAFHARRTHGTASDSDAAACDPTTCHQHHVG